MLRAQWGSREGGARGRGSELNRGVVRDTTQFRPCLTGGRQEPVPATGPTSDVRKPWEGPPRRGPGQATRGQDTAQCQSQACSASSGQLGPGKLHVHMSLTLALLVRPPWSQAAGVGEDRCLHSST